MLLEVRPAEADRPAFRAGRSGRPRGCRVAADQQHEGFGEIRFAFEPARFGLLREPVEAAKTRRDLPVPHDIPHELGHRGLVCGELRHDLAHEVRAGVEGPVRPGTLRRGTTGVGLLRVEHDQVAGADHVPVSPVGGRGEASLREGDEELLVSVRPEGDLAEGGPEKLQAAEVVRPPYPGAVGLLGVRGGAGGSGHGISLVRAILYKTAAPAPPRVLVEPPRSYGGIHRWRWLSGAGPALPPRCQAICSSTRRRSRSAGSSRWTGGRSPRRQPSTSCVLGSVARSRPTGSPPSGTSAPASTRAARPHPSSKR